MSRYAHARLVKCLSCGLVFAGSLPSAKELEEHYARYPSTEQPSELTVRRYRELLIRLEPFRKRGRLLDIGCGDGHFLSAARDHGWEVYGSEYGEAPRRRARQIGLDVRPAPFPQSADDAGSFDVITCIEVLEHVAAPQAEVDRISTLLRSGGCLYLTTPNFSSLSRRLIGPRWRVIEYPEHLNLFTPQTLERLLRSVGLMPLSVNTTGVSPSDIRSGLGRSRIELPAKDSSPGLDSQIRTQVASSPLLQLSLRFINLVLSRLGIGDTIKAFYVSP